MIDPSPQPRTLLYPAETLLPYFGWGAERQVAHFTESLEQANRYLDDHRPETIAPRMGKKTGIRAALQYFADEMFLTLYAFVSLDLGGDLDHLAERERLFTMLLRQALPALGADVTGPRVLLEQSLPAPKTYVEWLTSHFEENGDSCHPVWYRRRLGLGNSALEGATHTDALLTYGEGAKNQVALFEAKFLSDISATTTYAPDRDQLTRNLDAGLEFVDFELDRFVYVFVTPDCFKQRPQSRFYGYKLKEYMDPTRGALALARDLSHLDHGGRVDFAELSRRMGWVTWQDICALLAASPVFRSPAFPREQFETFFRERCRWPDGASCSQWPTK